MRCLLLTHFCRFDFWIAASQNGVLPPKEGELCKSPPEARLILTTRGAFFPVGRDSYNAIAESRNYRLSSIHFYAARAEGFARLMPTTGVLSQNPAVPVGRAITRSIGIVTVALTSGPFTSRMASRSVRVKFHRTRGRMLPRQLS
jgi:hypothetical protein